MQYFSIKFLEKDLSLLLMLIHYSYFSKCVQRYFGNICDFVLVFKIFFACSLRCAYDFIKCFCLLLVSVVGVSLKAGGQMRH